MRIALCMSGEMRGTPECLESIDRCVTRPLKEMGAEVDLLIYTRADRWWHQAASLPFRMLHVEKNVPMSDDIIVNHINTPNKGRFGPPGVNTNNRRAFLYQSYLQYYRSLQGMGELKRRAEMEDGKRYDWTARIRPDSGFEAPLDFSKLTEQVVYVPENDRWPHSDPQGKEMVTLSDKFAIGPSEMMDVYFDRINYLQGFCQVAELQAEALLVWQLAKANVPWETLDGCRVTRSETMYKYSVRPDVEE